ncbi:transposase family protein [Streptomyces sp. NPDC057575]
MQTDGPFWDSLVLDGIDEVDVEAVTAAFDTAEVVARGRAAGAACPNCGRFSDRVHDRYQRRLKDLPLVDQGFVIRLTVRRFICGSADCQRRTFADPFSRLAAPHARFTTRFNHALERVGLALAGRAGARLAAAHALVHEMLAQGHSRRAIARHLGWGLNPVLRYAARRPLAGHLPREAATPLNPHPDPVPEGAVASPWTAASELDPARPLERYRIAKRLARWTGLPGIGCRSMTGYANPRRPVAGPARRHGIGPGDWDASRVASKLRSQRPTLATEIVAQLTHARGSPCAPSPFRTATPASAASPSPTCPTRTPPRTT